MASTSSSVLLVTANVGSIFEEPEKMLPVWLREFLAIVSKTEPELLAIHCQEVGGKNYEETMQHVNKFITLLLDSKEMQCFDRARVFLDEDLTVVEKFTALGSLYFIHQSVKTVEIFDFQDSKFIPVSGKEIATGNIENVRTKEKAKFPQEFFPDFVWSRKGFIRTRWNLYNTKFDLVNIHLIHDLSNVAAVEASPSTFSKYRERALCHTIDRFETDQYEKCPFFIFGDFNFRLDTHSLVKQLTASLEEQRILGKKHEVQKILYKELAEGHVVLTIGKKDFKHINHNELFGIEKSMTLKKFDLEPEAVYSKLFEYPVTYPPSYPFSEDADDGTSYMPTRCPGWCDRIMMSHDALKLIENDAAKEYKMIGTNICMGDHKIRHPPITSAGQDAKDSIDGTVMGTQGTTADLLPLSDEGPEIRQKDHPPLRPVISINGLQRRSLDDKVAIGRAGSRLKFKNAVHSLVQSDNVLKIFLKRYSHRSDSESDTSDADDSPAVESKAPDTVVDKQSTPVMSPITAVEDSANTNNNNNNGASLSPSRPSTHRGQPLTLVVEGSTSGDHVVAAALKVATSSAGGSSRETEKLEEVSDMSSNTSKRGTEPSDILTAENISSSVVVESSDRVKGRPTGGQSSTGGNRRRCTVQ